MRSRPGMLLLVAALGITVSHSGDAMDDLQRKYGSTRIKAIEATSPEDRLEARRTMLKHQFEAKKSECGRNSERNRSYCEREAEQVYIRDLRKAEKQFKAAHAEGAESD